MDRCPACCAELDAIAEDVETVSLDCHDFPRLNALRKLTLCGECGVLFCTDESGVVRLLPEDCWAELRRHPAAGIIRAAQDRTVRPLYG